MKTFFITAAMAACALACAGQAAAQDATRGYTAEIGLTRAEVSDSEDITLGFNVLTARAGMQLNENFGLEAEAGFGVSEDTIREMGINVDAKLDWSFSAFLTGDFPVSDSVSLVGRIGYSKTQVSAEAGGFKATEDGDGLAGGVGLKFFPNGGDNGVRVDLSRYQIEDGDINAVSVTFIRRF